MKQCKLTAGEPQGYVKKFSKSICTFRKMYYLCSANHSKGVQNTALHLGAFFVPGTNCILRLTDMVATVPVAVMPGNQPFGCLAHGIATFFY